MKLHLNCDIYNISDIEAAIRAFQPVASISVVTSPFIFECEFRNCLHDELMTTREFENYLIDLMNSHGRVAD